MDLNIARLNIEYYHRLLADERDESKRQMIVRLLAEEQAKLDVLSTARPDRTNRG